MLKYHFEAIDHPEFLHVIVGGEHDSSAIAYDYMLRMIKSAREYQKQIIYLEEDFPDHPGILEMYQHFVALISHLEEFTIVLYDHHPSHYKRNKFIESAANELGAKLFVCKSKDEAADKLSEFAA